MLKRSTIINHFIAQCGYSRYLEIGVEGGVTFNNVQAPEKFAVDPNFKVPQDQLLGHAFAMTSDSFFDHNREMFDLVFIDGLHTFEQSLRDFTRAMSRVPRTGLILLDDCNPSDYLASLRDHNLCMALKKKEGYADQNWMGDVYKTVLFIREFFDNVSFAYIEDSLGIVAVWFEPRPLTPQFQNIEEISQCEFAHFRHRILPNLPFKNLDQIASAINSASRRISVAQMPV